MAGASEQYYVPHSSFWPIVASISLTIGLVGAAGWFNGNASGQTVLLVGLGLVTVIILGWFATVVNESVKGAYNAQVNRSFRQGMMWFIFSEVMFFGAFFGALFYSRVLVLPWLLGGDFSTHEYLWKGYGESWPTNGPGDLGGDFRSMGAWGIPALNTFLLLTSGTTITLAHWALKENDRLKTVLWMMATIALGLLFLAFQVYEYIHAYSELNLTLGSGIYGSTFFLLTGFHGMHVTLGTVMLIVITARVISGHFTPDNHFAFEGVAWYWHFVDVIWLVLFIFVYVL